MKLLILVLLTLTGCSTISEYNQGCRDGVSAVQGHSESTNKLCDGLDAMHKETHEHRK